jgi:hypothetical protein
MESLTFYFQKEGVKRSNYRSKEMAMEVHKNKTGFKKNHIDAIANEE